MLYLKTRSNTNCPGEKKRESTCWITCAYPILILCMGYPTSERLSDSVSASHSLLPPGFSTIMQPRCTLLAHLLLEGDESWLSDWFIACLVKTHTWINESTYTQLIGVSGCASEAQGWERQGRMPDVLLVQDGKDGFGDTLNKLKPLRLVLCYCALDQHKIEPMFFPCSIYYP